MRYLYLSLTFLFLQSACVVDVPKYDEFTYHCDAHSGCDENEDYYCAFAVVDGEQGRCFQQTESCEPGCEGSENHCVYDTEKGMPICTGTPPDSGDDDDDDNGGEDCRSSGCNGDKLCIRVDEQNDKYECIATTFCNLSDNGGFCLTDGAHANGYCAAVADIWFCDDDTDDSSCYNTSGHVCVECTDDCSGNDTYCYLSPTANEQWGSYETVRNAIGCHNELPWDCTSEGTACGGGDICVDWSQNGSNIDHDSICQPKVEDDCGGCGEDERCVLKNDPTSSGPDWGCMLACDEDDNCPNNDQACLTVDWGVGWLQRTPVKACYTCQDCSEGDQKCSLGNEEIDYWNETNTWQNENGYSCEDSQSSCIHNDECTDAADSCIGGFCQTKNTFDGQCDEGDGTGDTDDCEGEDNFTCSGDPGSDDWRCLGNTGTTGCGQNNDWCVLTCIDGTCAENASVLEQCDSLEDGSGDDNDCDDNSLSCIQVSEDLSQCFIDDGQTCDSTIGGEQCVSGACLLTDVLTGAGKCATRCDSEDTNANTICGEEKTCITDICLPLSTIGGDCDEVDGSGDFEDCEGGSMVCEPFGDFGPYMSNTEYACLYPDGSQCDHNYQCAGSFYCNAGTCAASKPAWHAIDLSDQTDFVDNGLGPLSLSLTSDSHPVIGYGAKENDNDIVRAKVYNDEFLWQEVDHNDQKALFVDVVVQNSNAIAAYNYEDPFSNYSIVVQQDGQPAAQTLGAQAKTANNTRPVLAALTVTKDDIDTHHAWVGWVDNSGELQVHTQTSDDAGTGTGTWSTIGYCLGNSVPQNITTSMAQDIAIETAGEMVVVLWRDANTLKFVMNDDVGGDNCWKSDIAGIDQLGQATPVQPQISFMKNGDTPVPIVAWHHIDPTATPVRDIKLARLHNDGQSWKTISFYTAANANGTANIAGNAHDLPQIAGDWLNDNHFYLAWRHCAPGAGESCNYENTTSENMADNLSSRALRIEWSDDDPTGYTEISDSLGTSPISATGVQDLKLAADGIRLCIASYHLPLASSNDGGAVGNIYMKCHDAETISP